MKTTLKKLTTLAVSAVLTLGSIIPTSAAVVNYGEELENAPDKNNYTQAFSDVPKSYWAFGYIGEMVDRGVLDGYMDGKFYPDKNVTRGEFAKIMTTAAGLTINHWVTWSDYADVTNHWSAPYVNEASYYLGGYTMNGEKYYKPDSPALREDIAVALVRLKGYSTAGYDLSIIQTMFSDWQSISSSAQPYVATAVEKGLISGYDNGTFRGQQGITRAEAATLLWRAYQYGNDNKVFEPEILPEIIATPEPTVAPTPKPTKTPKPTVEPDYDDEDDYYYEEEEEPEETPEPEEEYGWRVETIKGTIGGAEKVTAVPNGVAYIKDNVLYEMSDDGQKNIVLDCNNLVDTPENEKRSKNNKYKYTIYDFTYNNFNDCYYAIIYNDGAVNQPAIYKWYLYNITADEYIVPGRWYGTFYGDTWTQNMYSYNGNTKIGFFKDGCFTLGGTGRYSSDGKHIEGSDDEKVSGSYFIIKNEAYSGYSFGNENGLRSEAGASKSYRLWDDEILSINKDDDEELIIDLTDVYDDEDWFRIKYLKSENMTMSADESKLYYYDDIHDAMRVIVRND